MILVLERAIGSRWRSRWTTHGAYFSFFLLTTTLNERMFAQLKDFRRTATRYDKLARFLAGVHLAVAITGGSIESGS
ncbi:hypothetical protein X729_30910 [Mesorhizobium sp. L103C131B0]|nr:hypothetical protein X729_30910 [Mesorhizobium sp. L103C131B0]